MIYTPLTKKALALCFDTHKGQRDKSGMPYVFHPFHLAEQMDDELSTVCALLHDIVEDTDYTFTDLKNMGFSDEAIEVLRLLTRKQGMEYMDYIKNLSSDPTARKIKLADLRHNSDLSRFDTVTEYDLKRNEKYLTAIEYLTKL